MNQKGFAHIIFILIIAILLVLLFLFGKDKLTSLTTVTAPSPAANATEPSAVEWKTYSSPSGKTSIDYPSGWKYREFDDGVAFYNPTQEHEVGSEPIVLQELNKSLNDVDVTFGEYVKVAASHEIQNYESLSTIKQITTTSGMVGFETTWKVAPIAGSQGESTTDSLPITYFEIPGVTTSTFQVNLGSEKYLSVYEQMIKTFEINKTSNPTATPKADLETYTNSQHGFEVTYPKGYKALTNKDDLSGWPNAMVLFYNGGQAYDVVVEVWDSEAAYKEKYGSDSTFDITVKQAGGKYITLLNSTEEPENATIISSFKFTN